MVRDYLSLAWRSIRNRRLRSWLTMLGVVIGVTAVVALIAIGQGMQQSVEQEFEAIGFDTVTVIPGTASEGANEMARRMMSGGKESAPLDTTSIAQLSDAAEVAHFRTETGSVTSAAINGQGFLDVTGLSPGITETFSGYFNDFPLQVGDTFPPEDRQSAVLGHQVAENLGAELGSTVRIEDQPFVVTGILEDVDASSGSFSFRNMGSHIFIPIQAMVELYGGEGTVSMALVKADDGVDVPTLATQIERTLEQAGTPAMTITAEEVSQQISNVLGTLQFTLAAIAAISLLVGGIGVMNTMYTSVLERTREIGIMKAVGAKSRHVLAIFLIESGLMGILGGLMGVALGAGLSVAASRLLGGALAVGPAGGATMAVAISPELILMALAFSFLLGALSGGFPARQAAKLQPVQALQHE